MRTLPSASLGRDLPSSADPVDDRTVPEKLAQSITFSTEWHLAMRSLNPTAEARHLAAIAFLAALARTQGASFANADAVYIAGYQAKRQFLGRHLMDHERSALRRAADRVWSALQRLDQSPAHSRAVTQGEGGING